MTGAVMPGGVRKHKLALLGGGGHGKVVADTALSAGWAEVVFFDDAWPGVTRNGHWPVVGNTAMLLERHDEFDGVVVAIGNCAIRLRKHRELMAEGVRVVTLVHPRAWVSPYALVGAGSVLMAGAVVNVDARVGNACIVNTGATVDHDCVLADGVHVAPGAHLSGNVEAGEGSWIGVGAAVRQGIAIGAQAFVGAGAVVVRPVADGTTVIGNPAVRFERSRAGAISQHTTSTHLPSAMLNTSFSPWPAFTAQEADAIQRVLLSNKVNYWTGTECREFEKEFAAWCGTRHAVALANGTLALDVALKALGIGPGDEVVVTPRTFIASVSCVVNAGATPVFADVDPDTGNLSAATIAKVLTPRTRAVICVHLAGWPCDMDPIMELAAAHGFKVIEDCAQAHGARYKGRPVGSIGHVGAWSFCQDKIMTTAGEGGMVTTDDESLWRAMWAFKDHGKSYEAVYEREHAPGFRWLHESIGTNWRMLEIQAVVGRIQLGRMGAWSAQRAANANAIWEACRRHPALRVPAVPAGIEHAHYKCYAYVRPEELAPGWDRDRIIAEINALGVPCYQGSCSEVYLERAFDNTGVRPAEPLPVARELGATSIMFLVHPTLTAGEIEKTCAASHQVLEAAGRRTAPHGAESDRVVA